MTGVADLVARMRRIGADLAEVEVKAAGGGMPKSVEESLSAFSNGTGGMLILGLSEEDGFAPTPGFNATAIRDAVAGACADRMEPPIRTDIDIEEFDGALIVTLRVPELDPREKPSHVKTRGAYGGSFIRGGDGDRRLTHYEVTQLLSNRQQPTFDAEPVPGSTLGDLDTELTTKLVARARRRTPRAFKDADDTQVLMRLGAVRELRGEPTPTLGGILALGTYPQQFHPQLYVAVVALPGLEMGDSTPDGVRFLDNQTLEGPVPEIVSDAISVVQRNMSRAAVIGGLGIGGLGISGLGSGGIGREDRYDYPLEVIRELVVNAVMHRDYSREARGSHVQVEIYPDRLTVKSPGGLWGPVNADLLGTQEQTSATRNETLAKLLTEVPMPGTDETVCEKRGSGLPSVIRALRRAGMSPPDFTVTPAQTTVTIPRHALLSVETLDWISDHVSVELSDEQRLAIAIMHSSGRVTNQMLQAWGVGSQSAGQAVRDLVFRGIAEVSGGRRYASYRLVPRGDKLPDEPDDVLDLGPLHNTGVEAELDAIVQAVRAGHDTARALEDQLGINYQTLMRRIRVLRERNRIQQTQPARSKRQSYRVIEETP